MNTTERTVDTHARTFKIEALQSTSMLYHCLAATATAHNTADAREALELCLNLLDVAFTSTEIAVAGVAIDAAQRKLDAMLEDA